jgi:hypothetical protein
MALGFRRLRRFASAPILLDGPRLRRLVEVMHFLACGLVGIGDS